MYKEEDWHKLARNLLKAELMLRGISYDELSVALKKIGVEKTPNNINVTINRGGFSFIFFLQCAEAIDLKILNIK